MNRFIEKVRNNGCEYVPKGRSYGHTVYANLILMSTYFAVCIYTTVNLFFIDFSLLFILITVFFHTLFISCFFAIKKGFITLGKHLLIIAANLSIAVYDHLNGPGMLTFLILFAFIPTALNIFDFKKQFFTILFYLLLPLAYIFFSQFYSYNYFKAPVLDVHNKTLFKVFTIIEAFSLAIIFAFYMILRSKYKQNKLINQGLCLQTTLNNSIGAIWSIDTDFNLIAVNQKYTDSIEEEFGIREMSLGKNIKRTGLWLKFSPAVKQQYIDVLNGHEILHEIKINNKDFQISGVPIFNEKGKIIGATYTSRDITEDKIFENDLKEAKKKAEEASKAKEQFLSNMSHELRTPLNGIVGIVDILRDEKYLKGQKENFENLSNLSQHTVELVNNILDFAKIEAGKASLENKRFNLKKFIKKINSIFCTAAKLKGIHFQINVTGNEDIHVRGDETSLSQVLINIIGNAIKFTEQGTVELIIHIKEQEDLGSYNLHFSVKDSGIGIKKEHFNKIFEGFNQVDQKNTRKYGGTGLGLSISDKILQLMDSKLMMESEFGKGSRFYFSLKLDKSSYISPLKFIPTDTIENRILPKIKILLAEDNAINQLVATKILEKWQSTVTVVDNGLKAFEAVKENDFDIILMDLDMPVM
ncbi:MAG: ATP-binding protein, partial [Ferruginibacter sp.]